MINVYQWFLFQNPHVKYKRSTTERPLSEGYVVGILMWMCGRFSIKKLTTLTRVHSCDWIKGRQPPVSVLESQAYPRWPELDSWPWRVQWACPFSADMTFLLKCQTWRRGGGSQKPQNRNQVAPFIVAKVLDHRIYFVEIVCVWWRQVAFRVTIFLIRITRVFLSMFAFGISIIKDSTLNSAYNEKNMRRFCFVIGVFSLRATSLWVNGVYLVWRFSFL